MLTKGIPLKVLVVRNVTLPEMKENQIFEFAAV